MLAPWNESYDHFRQHIQKQRHYFAKKDSSSQSHGFPIVRYGFKSWSIKRAECQRIDAFKTVVLEKTLESPLDFQGDPTNPSYVRSVLGVHW